MSDGVACGPTAGSGVRAGVEPTWGVPGVPEATGIRGALLAGSAAAGARGDEPGSDARARVGSVPSAEGVAAGDVTGDVTGEGLTGSSAERTLGPNDPATAVGLSPVLAAELAVSPVTGALVRVASALAEVPDPSGPAGALPGLSDEARLAAVALAYQVEAQIQALQIRLLADVADRPILQLRGSTGPSAWLVGRQRVDPGKARSDVVLGQALRTELTATGRALAAGEINRDHARAVHATLARFPTGASEWHRAEGEHRLLELARRRDPRVVRRAGRTVLEEIDPDLYDTVVEKQLERDEATALQLRELSVRPLGDGRTKLTGTLTEPVAQALSAALDPLSAPLPSTADGPDVRSAGQRRHDGLGELVRRYQVSEGVPTHGGNGTEVVIRVSDGVLFGSSGRSGDETVARVPAGPGPEGRLSADADGGPDGADGRAPAAGGVGASGGDVAGLPADGVPVDAGGTVPDPDGARFTGSGAVPASTGNGWGHARYLRDGTPLSRALLEETLCDAKVSWIRFDSDYDGFWTNANPPRRFTGALRRALELRDGGCAFPGCDRPVGWTVAHHIIPWSQGGPTVLNNGVLFCGTHHRTIHHTDWTVTMAADGLPVFRAPVSIDPGQAPQRHQRFHPSCPDNPELPGLPERPGLSDPGLVRSSRRAATDLPPEHERPERATGSGSWEGIPRQAGPRDHQRHP